jgi:signal transduction histidine kinase
MVEMDPEAHGSPGKILVVDDDRILVEILTESLSMAGYEVSAAYDGQEAIAAAQRVQPDLILLDVMMPELDGYSACAQLKAAVETRFTPVIMLTALTDRDDKLRALEVGADEFMRKPPDRQELLIRIRSLLRTKRLYDQVQESHQRLEELEEAKHDLTYMIVHDMRGPVSSIISSLQLLREEQDPPTAEESSALVASSLLSGRRIMTMVEAMLDLQRLEDGKMPVRLQPLSIGMVIEETVQAVRPLLQEGRVRIQVKADRPAFELNLDGELLTRVVNNLLLNAVRFSPRGGRIGIWTQVTKDWVVVNMADQGPGIPPDERERVFQKYTQLGAAQQRRGLGLGLAFCRMAVEAMGGRIWVEDIPRAGAVFRFALPLAPAGG